MSQPQAAFVTGAARRIGRAIAEDLAAHGWPVAIHYRTSASAAEEVVARCRGFGVPAVAVEGDLADSKRFADMMTKASAALGPLTLLVNNASIFEADTFDTLGPDLLERQFKIDLFAPILLSQAFARQVPPETEGNIVHLIDQRALKLTPQFFSYQLAKSALLTATETMAQALAPRIRVNAIGPGPTLPSPRQNEEDFLRQAAVVPLGHPVDLADFGRTVRFLVETRSVTGQMIAVDAGQHLAWQTPDVVEGKE